MPGEFDAVSRGHNCLITTPSRLSGQTAAMAGTRGRTWARWLNAHPILHVGALLLLGLAVVTGGFTVTNLARIALGVAVGVALALYMRLFIMPNAMRNIGLGGDKHNP